MVSKKEYVRRYKKRIDSGWKPGNPKLGEYNQRQADTFAESVRPVIEELRAAGIITGADTARALNVRGIKSATGKEWSPQVARKTLYRLGFLKKGAKPRKPAPKP